jgi:twitching motility protein PilT
MSGIELSEMTDELVFEERSQPKTKTTSVKVSSSVPTPPQAAHLEFASSPTVVSAPSLASPSLPASAPFLEPPQVVPNASTPTPVSRSQPLSVSLPVSAADSSEFPPVPEIIGREKYNASAAHSKNQRSKVRVDFVSPQTKEALELFENLLAAASKGGASDVLLKRGQVPMFRWNGDLYPSRNGPRLESSFFENLASSFLSMEQCEKFNSMLDIDFSYQSMRAGRTRVNLFSQCGEIGLVVRLIPTEIPTFEKLEMSENLKRLVEHRRGLVLVTGATGSGKSTTLAALLDHINSTRTAHIITIEDPIEYVHSDKRSLFNQRELGLDTMSYADALRSALRQTPDVILIGELRDAETTEVALQAAETGHLVLSTLHTSDAADSLLRILSMTGHEKEAIVRTQLADSLRGVISQRLVKRSDGSRRIAAQEIMINTATIRERLVKGAHPSVVRDFIAQGANHGMQTFDQHLIQLVKAGLVDYEEALKNASHRDDFILRLNGVGDGRNAS